MIPSAYLYLPPTHCTALQNPHCTLRTCLSVAACGEHNKLRVAPPMCCGSVGWNLIGWRLFMFNRGRSSVQSVTDTPLDFRVNQERERRPGGCSRDGAL